MAWLAVTRGEQRKVEVAAEMRMLRLSMGKMRLEKKRKDERDYWCWRTGREAARNYLAMDGACVREGERVRGLED